jgi:hypothetical protein
MELTGILCQIKLYKTRAQKMFDCEIRIAANGIAARSKDECGSTTDRTIIIDLSIHLVGIGAPNNPFYICLLNVCPNG